MSLTTPMRRCASGLLATALAASATLAVTPHASATTPEFAGEDDTINVSETLIDAPQRGGSAIRALGEHLLVAAARNDMRPAALRSLLRDDSAAWVDTEGLVFFVEPTADVASVPALQAPQAAPLAETFALHSNPGAQLTILLDFDGGEVSGTGWNASGVTPGTHPAWDPAGDGAGFTDSELMKIQQVWAIVAEDYAPFNVDVTTQDPGEAGMVRSSSTDPTYGTRVLITPSDDPYNKLCNRACGGVAYLSVFDRVGSYVQPAWVFPQALGNSPKYVAEAATHEAGHNLGLQHDGTPSLGYYRGHGVWAPIMGVGYDRPLAQWSAGAYPGANNQQNDTAVVTGYLGARGDEASGSAATASALPPGGQAMIGTQGDVDAYLLGTCIAGSTVEVLPAALAPNLDVRAVLYDETGAQRSISAPTSGFGDGTTASGLGGSITVPTSGVEWVLAVEGVGDGTWATSGYDDYGSLGGYTVSAPGCDGALTNGVPGAPLDVASTSPSESALTLTWSAPTSEGAGPVTGYVVSRSGSSGSVSLPADARAHTFIGLTAGTSYQMSVRAVNATGAGLSVTVTASTSQPTPAVPSVPQNVTGSYNQQTGTLQAWWTEPANGGTQPVSGYAIYLDGEYLGQLGSTSRGVDITRDAGFTEGQYVVGIAALNAVGSSPVATATISVIHPSRPPNDDVANAEILPGASGSVTGDNASATGEPTDPAPPSSYGAGGRSVWFAWTPGTDGTVAMSTAGGGSNRDTTLAAYTGQPGALVQVAGNDDAIGLHAAITYEATAGTRYLIAVDGFSTTGGTGPFTLGWDHTPASAPAAPHSVTALAGDTSATVIWVAPEDNGSPIISYTVIARADGQADRTRTVDASTRSTALTGLTNGTPYSVTVTATNALGNSPESTAITVTPAVPDTSAPTIRDVASNPRTLDPFFGTGSVTVRMRLTDDRGIWGTPAAVVGPDSGTEFFDWNTLTKQTSLSVPMTLSEGSRRDGIWTASFTVPVMAPEGLWSAWTSVSDNGGNSTSTTRGQHPVFTVVTNPSPGSPPAAPTEVLALAGSTRAHVLWTAPAGGATDYTVKISPGIESVKVGGNATSMVVEGLTNGTAYTFTVVAGNSIGESQPSQPSNEVIPRGVPTPPDDIRAIAGDQRATITWQPTYLGNDVSTYRVTATSSSGAKSTLTLDGGTQGAQFNGLTNGTAYTFTVAAANTRGESPESVSSNVVTPVGVPTAPTSVSAVGGDRSAVLAWAAATGNGSPVTGYTATASPGGNTCATAGALTCTVTGLTNGTAYTFSVVASNAVGGSPASESSSAVTPQQAIVATPTPVPTTPTPTATPTPAPSATAPSRMNTPKVVVRGRKAIVSWKAAAANGSSITRYLIDISKGRDKTAGASARRTVFKNLRPGRYKVRIAAGNAVGNSAYSAWVKVRIR